MSEMKINKPLIRKMIKRMEAMPESYAQEVIAETLAVAVDEDGVLPRPEPACGTVACIAGEAIICESKTVKAGVAHLLRLSEKGEASDYATRILGLSDDAADTLFFEWTVGWPQPHRTQYANAKTYKGQARAAINLLKAILRTDGKILEGNQ